MVAIKERKFDVFSLLILTFHRFSMVLSFSVQFSSVWIFVYGAKIAKVTTAPDGGIRHSCCQHWISAGTDHTDKPSADACISSANILRTYKRSLYSASIAEWITAMALQARELRFETQASGV